MTTLLLDKRSRYLKIVYGVVLCAVAAGLGCAAPTWGFLAVVGAGIFGASGGIVVVTALQFTGRGPCPSCGAEMVDVLREAEGVQCRQCDEYVIVRAGHMSRTPDDAVAASAVYGINVRSREVPPFVANICVGCGQAADSLVEYEVRKVEGPIVQTWPVSMPVCAAHRANPGVLAYTATLGQEPVVFLRSYRAWRAAKLQRARREHVSVRDGARAPDQRLASAGRRSS